MPDRPNLIDVAAAGVSKSTAQRALANDSRCAEKTRNKVRGIAEKMGYVPDPIFAAVEARRRSKITRSSAPIAYLHASGTSRYSPGATYLPHCQKRASELGYRLEAIDIAKWHRPRVFGRFYTQKSSSVSSSALYGKTSTTFPPRALRRGSAPH